MSHLTSIDLFSGAGGLSLGLKQAGWNTLLSVEIDSHAVNSYKRNFPSTEIFNGDIRTLSLRKYRGCVDLVAGGPPCQPFSVAGSQRSSQDPRDMIPEFIRAVREIQPKYFLLENVAGLTSPRHAQYLDTAIESLRQLGYHVSREVLNAADFGVPQDRLRLFVVGSREPGFKFPSALYGPSRRYPHVSSAKAIRAAQPDEPNSAIVSYAKNPVLRPSPFAGMLVNGGGRPIDLSRPSQTIPASAGGNRTHIVDENGVLLGYHKLLLRGGKPRVGLVEGVRRLTVKESAKLQSFPDTFVFLGSRSSMYRQVGNAVPPKLAKTVAKKLADFAG